METARARYLPRIQRQSVHSLSSERVVLVQPVVGHTLELSPHLRLTPSAQHVHSQGNDTHRSEHPRHHLASRARVARASKGRRLVPLTAESSRGSSVGIGGMRASASARTETTITTRACHESLPHGQRMLRGENLAPNRFRTESTRAPPQSVVFRGKGLELMDATRWCDAAKNAAWSVHILGHTRPCRMTTPVTSGILPP